MNGQSAGRFCPGTSIIHKIDARAKICGLAILIAAVILTDSVLGYCLTVLVACCIIFLSKFSVRTAISPLSRLFKFFIFIFILNAVFFSSNEPIWQWWIFTLSVDGLIQGVNVVFRIVLIMVLANIMTLSTPPMELMAALERLISPLRFIFVPVEDVAMILSVAVSFIPTLLEETDTIKKAQTARGARFESKKLHERATAMLPLVVPIFISAFKRADELAMAMEARGYRGAKHRTKRKHLAMNIPGWLAIAACSTICAIQIFIF